MKPKPSDGSPEPMQPAFTVTANTAPAPAIPVTVQPKLVTPENVLSALRVSVGKTLGPANVNTARLLVAPTVHAPGAV